MHRGEPNDWQKGRTRILLPDNSKRPEKSWILVDDNVDLTLQIIFPTVALLSVFDNKVTFRDNDDDDMCIVEILVVALPITNLDC